MEKILNVPNAQRALVMIREQLNEINNTKPNFLDNIKFYYRMADKENKEGRRFFKLLNKTKDSLHSMRKEENSLILINKLLKKFIHENKEDTNNTPVINYLPTVDEFNGIFKKCSDFNLLVNKVFPTVSYKDIKRWFKNNPDQEFIKLFEIRVINNLTNIIDYHFIYIDMLEDWKIFIKEGNFIFTADCFKTGYSEFIGTGHRRKYVQKCIDLYGNVFCKYKDELLDNFKGYTTKINGTENDQFQGEFFNWKYAEATIENFR